VAAGIVAQPVKVGSAPWTAPAQNKTAAASGRSAATRNMVVIPVAIVLQGSDGRRCDAADCSGG